MFRALATAAVVSGLPARLSACAVPVRADDDRSSPLGAVLDLLGVPRAQVTMSVGPPRANRKPVLQLSDEGGQPLAYVKVGHDDLTRSLVRHEAHSLARVAEAAIPTLRCPDVLGLVEREGLAMLVLAPLPFPGRALPSRRAQEALVRCVADVASISGPRRSSWSTGPWAQRLRASLADSGPTGGRLLEQLATLTDLHPDLITSTWHGDLNPGNVLLHQGGAVVWDWERFEDGPPLGADLLHHHLSRSLFVRGQDPAASARSSLETAPDLLAPLLPAADGQEAVAVARIYLVALAARYLEDRRDNPTSPVARVEDWLLPALERAPTTPHTTHRRRRP
ncbi:phosphotransferase [uncultured Pseudokineococcus sp.]|uniref:phosphotransferase n=1 Tax=uncultured Pseudokineococcus sp. TaxID=1642928 RepID=UPI00262D4EB3|nr:phosphotransferase [uncultured Pseudokineococcus sp.]